MTEKEQDRLSDSALLNGKTEAEILALRKEQEDSND